jgi:hypothetical protein
LCVFKMAEKVPGSLPAGARNIFFEIVQTDCGTYPGRGCHFTGGNAART